MLSGRVFHWVMVLETKDFWNWVVEQRRIFSLCFVTVPGVSRTGLSASIRSRWSGDTATCSWRTLYRKARRLSLLFFCVPPGVQGGAGVAEQRSYARNVEKYIRWVTTLSLTMRIYLHSFSSCCLPNLRTPAIRPTREILRKFEPKACQGNQRSSILVPIESSVIGLNSHFPRRPIFEILTH